MLFIFFSAFSEAQVSPRYKECTILNGRVVSCDKELYTGPLIAKDLQEGGLYRECSSKDGAVVDCQESGWYNGKKVTRDPQDGYYKSCVIFNGTVHFCNDVFFSGSLVVPAPF